MFIDEIAKELRERCEEIVDRWNQTLWSVNVAVPSQEMNRLLSDISLAVNQHVNVGAVEEQLSSLDMSEAYIQVNRLVGVAVDANLPNSKGHCQKVARYAGAIGREMNLSASDLKDLDDASYLFDIGKVVAADPAYAKRGSLTERERIMIQRHPVIGAKMLQGIPFMQKFVPVAMHHHERYDGSGYPTGLKGENIPWMARIIGLVDAFAAMTTDRPYRAAHSIHEAKMIVEDESGRQFDPQVVNAFRACFDTLVES